MSATEVRAYFDAAWPDPVLAAAVVAIIDDAPLSLSLALLQNTSRSVVLYAGTFALLSRLQNHELPTVEHAIMSSEHVANEPEPRREWFLSEEVHMRLKDVLEEAPETGSWGSVCKTLLKTYSIWWELAWSTRFRLFLCTFL